MILSYDVDELFHFWETEGGYSVEEYLKKDDPTKTEIKIPAEYNGKPVVEVYGFRHSEYLKRVKIPPSVREIRGMAFYNCASLEKVELSEGLEIIGLNAFEGTGLKSITLPKSLMKLSDGALQLCPALERVEFGGEPLIGLNNFRWCPKLPPETVVMGMVCSTDITSPISDDDIQYILLDLYNYKSDLCRPEIFELLAKNNCFRNCDLAYLFKRIINVGRTTLFQIAEQYGMLNSAGLLDMLTEHSAQQGKTEITAYLLELKKRKLGFNGLKMGDNYEL